MIMKQIICLKSSLSKLSCRSDFYDIGASIFTKSELRFLQKNIISEMMFFQKSNADF